MRRDKDSFDPAQPALLVTYGNTARKHRHLDGDLIVLGRSSICDFSLVSPEVAPVHCVLVRSPQGWRIRDCSGRPGTRVNGKVVQESLLDDGDIIQIGAFSFQAHLPAGHTPNQPLPPPIPPTLISKLQRSRRRLFERAQRFRKLLGERYKAVEIADKRLATDREEMQRIGESLRIHQREYELRMKRLELSERDLATDRATLEKEYKALQEEVERHSTNVRLFREEAERKEKEMSEQQVTVKAELERLWDDWREHSVSDESPKRDEEQAKQLEIRARELDSFAQHLKRCKETGAVPTPLADPLVREWRDDSFRLVTELRTVLQEARGEESGEVSQLRQERDEARQIAEIRTKQAAEQIAHLTLQVKELKKQVSSKPVLV